MVSFGDVPLWMGQEGEGHATRWCLSPVVARPPTRGTWIVRRSPKLEGRPQHQQTTEVRLQGELLPGASAPFRVSSQPHSRLTWEFHEEASSWTLLVSSILMWVWCCSASTASSLGFSLYSVAWIEGTAGRKPARGTPLGTVSTGHRRQGRRTREDFRIALDVHRGRLLFPVAVQL